MPLHDHFHPPLYPQRTFEGIHNSWAACISEGLNRVLPEGYYAEFEVHWGSRIEIDVAAFENDPLTAASQRGSGGGTATMAAPAPRVWKPPAAAFSLPAVFPDGLEILVYHPGRSVKPIAAIEIVSPGNKDRPDSREAFVAKCSAYLQRRMGLVILDVVTERRFNLHNELVDFLHAPDSTRIESELYAVAYRPVKTRDAERIDVWPGPLAVGESMPTVPLPLDVGLFVPVDLEATYTEACARIRLPV